MRVGYSSAPIQPQLYGQRKLQVRDTTGEWRIWEFTKPSVIVQDEFENLFFKNDDPRSTPFLVLYSELQITHPTNVTEFFSFDPSAGMALKTVKDYSGNVTQYLHEDVWSLPGSLNWVPPGYFASFYADPTAQINPQSGRKYFKYNDQRFLKEITDEEGRRTQYDVEDNTGLRLRERIYSPAPENMLVQETHWEYGHPQFPEFPAFVRRKTVHRHASDPAWAASRIAEYTPDAYGYVQKEEVWEGTKWLITEYEHDKNGNRIKVWDPRRHLTEFTYDKLNRLRTITYPLTAGLVTPVTKTLGYDARGNKVSEKDERGNYSLWLYDEWSRVKQQVRDMNGNALVDPAIDLVTTFAYNRANSRTTVKDPRGYTTTTWYDSLQRPYLVRDAKDNQTQLFYDGPNAGASAFDVSGFKPTSTIDPRGYRTEIEYDVLYRPYLTRTQLTKAPLPVTYAVTQTDYDEVGNALKVWDPLNPKGGANSIAVTTDYDALNRPAKVTYQDGTFAIVRWTTTGLKWQTEDENRVVTETKYDGVGRAVTVTSGINGAGNPLVPDESGVLKKVVTTTGYDDSGNVALVTDPLDHEWKYVYDGRNRKTDEFGPSVFDVEAQANIEPHTQWAYDGVGNTVKVIDAKGSRAGAAPGAGTTDMRYDKANRLYETEGPAVATLAGTLQRPLTKTFYDKNGNVEDIDDANRHVTHNVYDELNRLLSTRDAELNTVSYSYDAVGNRTAITDPRGTTTLEYDGLNRLTKSTDAATKATRFEYNGLTKTARVDAQSRRTEYRYDSRHRLEKVWYYAPDGTPVDDATNAWRTYGYDDAGNLLSVVEPQKGGAADVGYTYDALNRVQTETSRGLTHVYRYDLAGNRRRITYGGTNRVVEHSFDDVNRLSAIVENGRTTSYGYDLNGNIARKT
ncbi:MAG: RHS repeat protein, partial [Verrucomicrobiaceae bacterium]